MTTERIDVLARVESIKRHLISVGAHADYIEHCDTISAAVVELIAADKECDEAQAEFYAVAMDRETANERYMRQGRYITARKRRAAALARIGPQS